MILSIDKKIIFRITSYNVCYTKLLRIPSISKAKFDENEMLALVRSVKESFERYSSA